VQKDKNLVVRKKQYLEKKKNPTALGQAGRELSGLHTYTNFFLQVLFLLLVARADSTVNHYLRFNIYIISLPLLGLHIL